MTDVSLGIWQPVCLRFERSGFRAGAQLGEVTGRSGPQRHQTCREVEELPGSAAGKGDSLFGEKLCWSVGYRALIQRSFSTVEMTLETSLNHVLAFPPIAYVFLTRRVLCSLHLPPRRVSGCSARCPGATFLKQKWLISFPNRKAALEETWL